MNNPKGQPIFIDESPLSSELIDSLTEKIKLDKGTMIIVSTPTGPIQATSYRELFVTFNHATTPKEVARRTAKAIMKANPDKYPLAKAIFGD